MNNLEGASPMTTPMDLVTLLVIILLIVAIIYFVRRT